MSGGWNALTRCLRFESSLDLAVMSETRIGQDGGTHKRGLIRSGPRRDAAAHGRCGRA